MRYLRTVLPAGLALVSFLASNPAAARDRPGTPIDQQMYVCFNDGYRLPKSATAGPPAVCVEFTNTANEEVTFDLEISANGVRQPSAWIDQHVTFHYTASQMGNTVGNTMLKHSPVYVKRNEGKGHWRRESFGMVELAFDTLYCVQVRSRQKSGGIVSAGWSSGNCVRTRRS